MLGHRSLSPEDYLAILKKRWWIIAIPAILFPIIAYAASYLVQPQYLSQTLVLVEQQKVPDKYVTPVIVEDINARLSSMKEQILSRSRLQPILDQFDLFSGNHMNADDRLDLMRKNIDIKPIESEDVARSARILHFVQGERRAYRAGRLCRDHVHVCRGEPSRSRDAD